MISLEKIAELSGVSRRTVARALKDKSKVKPETLAKIEEVLKHYDYKPNLAARYLAAKSRNYKILFMLLRAKTSPFHAEIYQFARQKAQELESFGIKIDFFVLDRDLHNNSMNYEELMNNFNYDFLITIPVYEAYFKPYFNKLVELAEKKKIPYIFYNMDDKNYNRLCYVGCDNEKAGRIAAGLIAMGTGQKGKVAIISNMSSSVISFYARTKGFKDELSVNYPEVKIVYEHTMEQDRIDVDFDYLRKLKVEAVYLVNPGDYSVCLEIQKALYDLNVKIVTNDCLNVSKKMMKDGLISALITQEHDKQAQLPLEIAFNYLANNFRNIEDCYFTDLSIVIRQCL